MSKPSLQYISNTKGIRIPKPTNLLLTLCLEIYAVKKDSRSLLMRSLLSTTMILKFKYNFPNIKSSCTIVRFSEIFTWSNATVVKCSWIVVG